MTEDNERSLSSLEMLWMGLSPSTDPAAAPLRLGAECPQCSEGKLDYNGLLQLECPLCGFVSAEGAGCT